MPFYTKIRGVTFENRQSYIKTMSVGDKVELIKAKYSNDGGNAIKVIDSRGNHIGFLSKELSAEIVPSMERGFKYRASVSSITGREYNNLGVNLCIEEYVDIPQTNANKENMDNISNSSAPEYPDYYDEDDGYVSYASEFPDMEAYESWYESSDF